MTLPKPYKVNYDFKQIQKGLIGFIGDIELKLQAIIEDLPVMVIQTGDLSYYLDKKFNKIENQEIYQSVPRITISVSDVQYNEEEKTNPYNNFIYKFNEKEYCCTARRMTLLLPIEVNFVSSNFIKMLESFEIMATIIARANVYTYEFGGNTFEACYSLSSNSNENPAMEVSSASRNSVAKSNFDLQLHIIVPRINTIQLLTDATFVETRYTLIDNAGMSQATDTLSVKNPEPED